MLHRAGQSKQDRNILNGITQVIDVDEKLALVVNLHKYDELNEEGYRYYCDRLLDIRNHLQKTGV